MMAPNLWGISLFFCCSAGIFCLWNCLTRERDKLLNNWYGCTDQDGNPTDSFILYKLPKLEGMSNSIINEGTGYMYMTSGSMRFAEEYFANDNNEDVINQGTNWILSNISINDPESIPARTLNRIYQDSTLKDDAIVIMYNDEFPDGSTSLSHGHTKGVVVMSEYGGFWLVHSVPKYPPHSKDGYSYPSTAHRFGQSMLCISLGASEASNLAWQLVENYPYIYESNIPPALNSKFPVFEKVVSGYKPQRSPFYRVGHLKSISGKAFTSFAKYRKYQDDIYSGLVAPTLQSNLLVETWRNGPGPIPSSCNLSYSVQNIESLLIPPLMQNFTTHHDHSKWAIGESSSKPYVCIGDINRMKTQLHRAGGTVCVRSLDTWYSFHSLIESIDTCPTYV